MTRQFGINSRCPWAALLALAAAGCAVPRTVREDARLMALYTQRLQREAEEFADLRSEIARARTRNVNTIEESALAAEQAGTAQLLTWRIAGDEARVRLLEGILEGTKLAAQQRQEVAARREAHAKAVMEARGGVEVRQENLAATAQALAQIGEKPDRKGERAFYLGFFKQVRAGLDEARKAANAQAEEAVAAVEGEQSRP